MITMPIILTLAGYFTFSAAVGAMNPPTDVQKGQFYGWLYRFLQRLAANATELAHAKFGGFVPPPDIPPPDGGSALTVAATTVESRTLTVASSDHNS